MDSRKAFEKRLIDRYKELKEREKQTSSLIIGGMYRDEIRKIEKIYLKNFKKTIDKLPKVWYNKYVIKRKRGKQNVLFV